MRVLANKEFEFISRVVYAHSRIVLTHEKKALVMARLSKRLNQLGLETFGEYCAMLNSPDGKHELQPLLDAITTNFTHFFREPKHFEYLYNHILPEWSHKQSRHKTSFRVWSAGCSTGEEAYSIGILLADYFQSQSPLSWQLVASDLSTRVLKDAEQGVYRNTQIKKVKTEWLRSYFRKGIDRWDGYYRIKPTLRGQVNFVHANLFQSTFPFRPGFNVIFCRNVMIYFDRQTQEELFHRLIHFLAPGGYLIVGHSEGLTTLKHSYIKKFPSVVQKP